MPLAVWDFSTRAPLKSEVLKSTMPTKMSGVTMCIGGIDLRIADRAEAKV
jgi:hypothetical protein